jgi:hypothetical protein
MTSWGEIGQRRFRVKGQSADVLRPAADITRERGGPGCRILIHGKSGGAEGGRVGFDPRGVAANELGFAPAGDCELRSRRHQARGRSLRFLGLALFVVGNRDIGESEAGISRVIGLEGRDCVIGSPGLSIGVSKCAQIHRGIIWAESHRLLGKRNGLFRISRGQDNKAGKLRHIGRAGRQSNRLSGVSHGFVMPPFHQQNHA